MRTRLEPRTYDQDGQVRINRPPAWFNEGNTTMPINRPAVQPSKPWYSSLWGGNTTKPVYKPAVMPPKPPTNRTGGLLGGLWGEANKPSYVGQYLGGFFKPKPQPTPQPNPQPNPNPNNLPVEYTPPQKFGPGMSATPATGSVVQPEVQKPNPFAGNRLAPSWATGGLTGLKGPRDQMRTPTQARQPRVGAAPAAPQPGKWNLYNKFTNWWNGSPKKTAAPQQMGTTNV
jgi:hypothetical protein